MYRSHVLVCGGTGCTSSGSETLISLLQEELKKNGLENEVDRMSWFMCTGSCYGYLS